MVEWTQPFVLLFSIRYIIIHRDACIMGNYISRLFMGVRGNPVIGEGRVHAHVIVVSFSSSASR